MTTPMCETHERTRFKAIELIVKSLASNKHELAKLRACCALFTSSYLANYSFLSTDREKSKENDTERK